MKKIDSHIFQGMQRDTSISKQSPQFLWDAHNIRLTAKEGDTLLSMTNEKGPSIAKDDGDIDIVIQGQYIGHCVIGNYLTVFSTTSASGKKEGGVFTPNSNPDYITRYKKNDDGTFTSCSLYNGNLGFNVNYPLETVGVYESEYIQKVYWTDNLNQPRVINITKDLLTGNKPIYNDDSFDFVQKLALNENITVSKNSDSSGTFPSGVIQYAITYFNKYGQESNIVYTTPLLATSFIGRAGSPEEKISNSFKITIKNPDYNFEYIRLYSIFRTSINATPSCKKVTDVQLIKQDVDSSDNINNIKATNISYKCYVNVENPAGYCKVRINTDTTDYLFITDTSFSALKENDLSSAGTTGGAGNYWHFTKAAYPYLIIQDKLQNGDIKYFTWDSDTNDIYISEGMTTGAGAKYYRIATDGGKLIEADSMAYVSQQVIGIIIDDNGSIGENIEPEELMYIGGESIKAGTMTQKDGTLFLGDVSITRNSISDTLKTSINNLSSDTVKSNTRTASVTNILNSNQYSWANQLNAKNSNGYSTNTSGFKAGEHYRLGIQFQYETGKWSEPIRIGDFTESNKPSISGTALNIPGFELSLPGSIGSELYKLKYRKARAVAVFPKTQDRLILAQGIVNPTVYNLASRQSNSPYAQSSWFFRPTISSSDSDNSTNINYGAYTQFKHNYTLFGFTNRGAEIQGTPCELNNISTDSLSFPLKIKIGRDTDNTSDKQVSITEISELTNIYAVDRQTVTFHSPDIEFDDSLNSIDLSMYKCREIGKVQFTSNSGDIDIMTSTPTIGNTSAGFYHKALQSLNNYSHRRLCAGLFYWDYIVDDDDIYQAYGQEHNDFAYMVYPWNREGSLNNDCNRPTDKGTRTALLKRKKTTNILFSNTFNSIDYTDICDTGVSNKQLFNSDQVSMVKVDNNNYYGNIDTVLASCAPYGSLFTNGGKLTIKDEGFSKFTDTAFMGLFKTGVYSISENGNTLTINNQETDIGDDNGNLRVTREAVRIKYKSTPHLVMKLNSTLNESADSYPYLYMAELYRDALETDFGGKTTEAYKSNLWIPVGEPVALKENAGENITVNYSYGDTWYQRYDCLKTYAFTNEDLNSVIEIGSFMCETHVNIDGRYDRNRGQNSNLNISPTNFNLINKVYSQENNFFNYRIMDSDYYNMVNYPTMITWTKQKSNASQVDLWSNITLASTLQLDGTKGKVEAVRVNKNLLYCFQTQGISQILFNSRVQIPTSDGVPVEISNNYKVDGNRYISTTVGCYNKKAIAESPNGIYFIDGMGSALYLLNNDQLSNISDTHGFGYWFSQLDTINKYIPAHSYTIVQYLASGIKRIGYETVNQQGLSLYYDYSNYDLYINNADESLCYSELLQQFVSFYSYGNYQAMFNMDNKFYDVNFGNTDTQYKKQYLCQMFNGEYNNFIIQKAQSDFTFISNADSTLDKIFTNVNTRVNFFKNKVYDARKFFDTIQVWNEYQDTGEQPLTYNKITLSNTKMKFRVWNVTLPRDSTKKLDRIRNTWTKLKFTMNNPNYITQDTDKNDILYSMELHDIGVVYYT